MVQSKFQSVNNRNNTQNNQTEEVIDPNDPQLRKKALRNLKAFSTASLAQAQKPPIQNNHQYGNTTKPRIPNNSANESSSAENVQRQTNYYVYHNTFAAPSLKVDFIGLAKKNSAQ